MLSPQSLLSHFLNLHKSPYNSATMSDELLMTMCMVKKIFDDHAGKDGDSTTLSKAELSTLLKAQKFPAAADQAKMDELFKTLDADADGVVSFEEFVVFVSSMIVMVFK